jgi:pheromone shutdown-related protein TraB
MNNNIEASTSVSGDVTRIDYNDGRKLYLIGTAHVSRNSAELVENSIMEIKPDKVCIELDQQRFDAITKKNRYEDIDIFQIIKKRQLFFFIGQFIMAAFQKKISEKTGSKPGEEFLRAIKACEEHEIDLKLIDRNIGTTLKRAWRLTPFRHKMKFLGALLTENSDELENINIEEMKNRDAIDEMVKAFSDDLPVTKRVLIDERDIYLTYGIQKYSGNTTLAVVGAGHVPGILARLKDPVDDDVKNELDYVPPPSLTSKILPWLIPALVAAVFIWGFTSGRKEIAGEVALYWVLANGILTSIGCLLAFAHPITVVAGFIAAPITSLNPTIGAGFVTAIVQSFLVKPRIMDFEQINNKSLKIREWWKNRVTKIFLVFIFSSIGSSIGTFVALPALRKFFY